MHQMHLTHIGMRRIPGDTRAMLDGSAHMRVAGDAQPRQQANAEARRLAEVMAGAKTDCDDVAHGSRFASRLAEHAPEDRVDMLEMITEVELLFDLAIAEVFLHRGFILQQGLKVALAAPYRHRVALHELVGVLAAGALLRQRDQKPLRMDPAAPPGAGRPPLLWM